MSGSTRAEARARPRPGSDAPERVRVEATNASGPERARPAPTLAPGASAHAPPRLDADLVARRRRACPRPLHIPASKVQHAIDDGGRSMHARTVYGPDGKPAGTRISGVNNAGAGLRDGDIIVSIDGKPTMDDDAATDAALSVVARGDSVLHARLTRDGQPFDVTVELPLAPINPGKDAR